MTRDKKEPPEFIKNLEIIKKENNEKFRFLIDLTNEMIGLHDVDAIYKKIVNCLEKLYPDSVILYVSINEKEMETRLETIAGIDNALLKKVLSVSGFNPIGKKYKLVPSHQDYFRTGEFVEFAGGLSDFSANEFPLMAAHAIERLIGLYKIYTIGIKKDEKLLGAIHFFTFNHKVIDDSSFIEILVKQAGIILEKRFTEKALLVSETNFKALFEKAPLGIAYHRMVYDKTGKPIDYFFIEANQSYQILTGVNPVGKLATEAFPGIERDPFDWIGTFGKVAKTGEEIRFQQFLQYNNRWYDCVGYQYKPDHFVSAFFEITDKKHVEVAFNDIASGLSVLNEATAGFTDMRGATVFYADIVRRLKALTGGMTATLSIYNPEDKCLYVNNADIEPGVVNGLIQALGGKRVYEVGFPVSDKWYQQLSVKPIAYYKTLNEASFGVISKIAGSILQKAQRIDRFLGIAYFLDNELFGTSLVAFRSNVPDPPEDLIHSYAHMVAMGLSRTRSEENLRQNEEKYRNIFENVQDIYYEATLEGTILEVSPSIEILTEGQYTRKSLIGRSMNDFYVDIGERNKLISALLEQGRVTDFELTLKIGDNRIVPCSISSKLGYDNNGQPEKIIGSMHDISERKRSENALRNSEQNLQTLFDTIAEGVSLNEIIYDQNGVMVDYKILQVNKSFYTIAVTTPDQVIGSLATQLYGMSKEMIHQFWLEHQHRKSTITSEMKSPKDDRWFFVSTSPFADGKFVTTFSDITERKQAEIELINAKAKAEESDRLKTAFLATMNHELRTPLNLILGFSELIKSGVAMDEYQKFATIINDSGLQLHSMIEDVFNLALLEHENIKIRLQTFSLIDHFIENKASLDDLLINSGKNDQVKLVFKPDTKKLSGFVTADRSKINQVLTAIFKNAVRFTHTGTIEFGYRIEDKSEITFYVKDSGIGITNEQQSIIFELFRKGEDSNSNGYSGIGIGLTIAQKITKILKGNLTVESTFGKGSSFSLTVPVEISERKNY